MEDFLVSLFCRATIRKRTGGPHGSCSTNSLVTYPAAHRYTTPAHTSDQAAGERLAAAFIAGGSRHGNGLRSVSPLCRRGADGVLASLRRLEHPEPSARVMRYAARALTSAGFLQGRR